MTKKQFLFGAVIISATIVSCSKEKSGTPQTETTIDNSITFKPIGFDPLKIGLAARFEFDGSLVDLSGKLKDATPIEGKAKYTTDRKGAPDHAFAFDGTNALQIFNVPLDVNGSVAMWVQSKCYPTIGSVPFVEGQQSFLFTQLENTYLAGFWSDIPGPGQYVEATAGREWHHLAATRDASVLKFYIDGILVGTSPTPVGSVPAIPTSEYILGFGWNAGYFYWTGSMDDLRFYKRVLTSSEVDKLAHL